MKLATRRTLILPTVLGVMAIGVPFVDATGCGSSVQPDPPTDVSTPSPDTSMFPIPAADGPLPDATDGPASPDAIADAIEEPDAMLPLDSPPPPDTPA